MLAVGVIGFGGINSYLPGGGDNAGYIAEAEALLRHGQRLSLYELGSPPATFKAPLFPILLAGVEALFGRNVAAMKALLVLCAMGAVWAAWWALRCGLEEGEAEGRNAGAEAAGAPEEARSFQAAVLALWFALMPILALTCHDVLTDVPFTALTLLVIGCAGRAAWPGAAYRTLIPLVALLVVATFLRSAGVLLGAACVAYLGLEALLRRKEKCFPRLVLGCVVIAALTGGFLWLQQRGPRTYVSLAVQEITAPAERTEQADGSRWTQSAPARSLRTARFYAIFLAADVGGYDSLAPKGAAYALIIGACGVAALGMVEMLRRGKRLVPVCFVVYLLFFVVVTWVDRRYYLPVLPLWLCLLWVGAARIFGWARTQGKWVTALVVSALGIFPMVGVFGTLLLFGRREIEATTGVEWAAAALLLIGLVVYLTRTTPEPAPEQQPAPPGRLSQDPLWLVLAGAFLLLATCRGVSENVVRERRTGPAPAGTGWADLYDAACWLKQNAQPGEAVVSDRMALVWFWSGLQGVPIPRTRDLTEVAQRVQPAQWFILDDLREDRMAQRYLKPYVAKTRGAWEARWHQGETWVLRRKNAAPPP